MYALRLMNMWKASEVLSTRRASDLMVVLDNYVRISEARMLLRFIGNCVPVHILMNCMYAHFRFVPSCGEGWSLDPSQQPSSV